MASGNISRWSCKKHGTGKAHDGNGPRTVACPICELEKLRKVLIIMNDRLLEAGMVAGDADAEIDRLRSVVSSCDRCRDTASAVKRTQQQP